MNRNIALLIFFNSLLISQIYPVDSKLLNLEVLLQGILFYIVCIGSDIDRRNFCRYVWDNLFRKPSVLLRESRN
jgi:hypothetical protein